MLPIIWLEEATHQATLDMSWLKYRLSYDRVNMVNSILMLLERAKKRGANLSLPLCDSVDSSAPRWVKEEIETLNQRLKINEEYVAGLHIPVHALFLNILGSMDEKWYSTESMRMLSKIKHNAMPNEIKNLFEGIADIDSLRIDRQEYQKQVYFDHPDIEEASFNLAMMREKLSWKNFVILLFFILNPCYLPQRKDDKDVNFEADPQYSILKRFRIVTEIVNSSSKREDFKKLTIAIENECHDKFSNAFERPTELTKEIRAKYSEIKKDRRLCSKFFDPTYFNFITFYPVYAYQKVYEERSKRFHGGFHFSIQPSLTNIIRLSKEKCYWVMPGPVMTQGIWIGFYQFMNLAEWTKDIFNSQNLQRIKCLPRKYPKIFQCRQDCKVCLIGILKETFEI